MVKEEQMGFFDVDEVQEKFKKPTFSCRSQRIWQDYLNKNKNAYGLTILEFANLWATEMELKMNGGTFKDLSDEDINYCEKKVLHQFGDITGFMYSMVLRVLKDTWKYGIELDEWNKKSCQ